MGLNPFHRSACSHSSYTVAPLPPNPNPKRFTILRSWAHLDRTIVEIHYPDATNYEGRKILVYLARPENVLALSEIDPHFCEDHLSPFARFEPTERGWRAAQALCMSLV